MNEMSWLAIGPAFLFVAASGCSHDTRTFASAPEGGRFDGSSDDSAPTYTDGSKRDADSDGVMGDGTTTPDASDHPAVHPPPGDGAIAQNDADGVDTGSPLGDSGKDDASTSVASDGQAVDAAPVTDGGADATVPPCAGPLVRCGGSCTNLREDPNNCGTCEHQCGDRASCSEAVCQPIEVHAITTGAIDDLRVDATGIFVLTGNSIVTCGPAGCTGAPRPIATEVTSTTFGLANGHVLFTAIANTHTGLRGVRLCPVSGCAGTPTFLTVASGGAELSFATSSKDAFYSSWTASGTTGSPIKRCSTPVNGQCSSTTDVVAAAQPAVLLPTETTLFYEFKDVDTDKGTYYSASANATNAVGTLLGPGSGATPARSGFFAYRDDLYFVYTVPAPGVPRKLVKCPATGCASTPTEVLSPFADVPFAVDASGYYWLLSDRIVMCPLAGCSPAAAVTVATASSPSLLRLTDEFVYWVGTGSTATSVFRVAKP